jgi:hypothetical protein
MSEVRASLVLPHPPPIPVHCASPSSGFLVFMPLVLIYRVFDLSSLPPVPPFSLPASFPLLFAAADILRRSHHGSYFDDDDDPHAVHPTMCR